MTHLIFKYLHLLGVANLLVILIVRMIVVEEEKIMMKIAKFMAVTMSTIWMNMKVMAFSPTLGKARTRTTNIMEEASLKGQKLIGGIVTT